MTENGNRTLVVDEDPGHWRGSVRQSRGLDLGGDPSASLTPLVPAGLERQDVGEPDPSVPASGQPLRGNLAFVEQADDERPGQPQELSHLGGSE